MPEPGRRIVTEERARGGTALPWSDPEAFARRALDMARSDLDRMSDHAGVVFFDRGLIDAASALEHLTGTPLQTWLGGKSPYADPVFLAPPWREIYAPDADRRHDFAAAEAEYHRLSDALDRLGHKTIALPKAPIGTRLTVVLSTLDLA